MSKSLVCHNKHEYFTIGKEYPITKEKVSEGILFYFVIDDDGDEYALTTAEGHDGYTYHTVFTIMEE